MHDVAASATVPEPALDHRRRPINLSRALAKGGELPALAVTDRPLLNVQVVQANEQAGNDLGGQESVGEVSGAVADSPDLDQLTDRAGSHDLGVLGEVVVKAYPAHRAASREDSPQLRWRGAVPVLTHR